CRCVVFVTAVGVVRATHGAFEVNDSMCTSLLQEPRRERVSMCHHFLATQGEELESDAKLIVAPQCRRHCRSVTEPQGCIETWVSWLRTNLVFGSASGVSTIQTDFFVSCIRQPHGINALYTAVHLGCSESHS